MARLELRQVSKRFGDTTVIHGVDLTVQDGEFCVFVGPSGCGKSTLLRMIAGLEECSDGTVLIDDQDVTDQQPARRGIAMVFQSYALYPHMTVRENMGFGLKIAGVPPAEIARKVAAAAATLQIDHLLQRRPKDLSGGQRQRVAIGRAIVRDPRLFLFDEPLSNLDAALRVEMRVELHRIKSQLNRTIIYVTHDQVEAMTLADRIVVLREGRIEQAGPPLELYQRPANLFVAAFIGSPKMNLLPVTVAACGPGRVELTLTHGGTVALDCDTKGLALGNALTLGVRPEHLRVEPVAAARLQGQVLVVERLGVETYCHVRVADQIVIAREDGNTGVQTGDTVWLGFDQNRAHLFGPDGTRTN
jgi:multiple sugar transport system ATP-binding protein